MTGRKRYPDEAIVIGLRVLSLERGRQTAARGLVPVTALWWDEHRDPAVHPPACTVVRRFGTWTRACEVAGVPTRPTTTPRGQAPRWTDEEVLEHLGAFLAGARRHATTFAAYSAWARKRRARPSGATVLKRFGTYSEACRRARSR